MKYVVFFEDDDRYMEKRQQHMAEHLAFLAQNADRIEAAGPLFETPEENGAGGLWLIDAESLSEVRELIESDPFWPTGLRKSVRTLLWQQVFANGQRKHQTS